MAENSYSHSTISSRFDTNASGRDFVVGDIHGMFTALESLLGKVSFNPERDRVFAVGDLVNRGPESERALEFLALPWFTSILGNHELMLRSSNINKADLDAWMHNNGGDWWLDASSTTRNRFIAACEMLPVVAEISTNEGTVGLIHAEVPEPHDWLSFVELLENEEQSIFDACWSRERYWNFTQKGQHQPVNGIDKVIVGHTPITHVLNLDNVYYIDTGAAFTAEAQMGVLTMMQIQPEVRFFSHNIRDTLSAASIG